MSETWLRDTYRTYFLGLRMAQYWVDLLIWERFFKTYGGTLKAIVDLGTYHGAFSIFLLLQATQYGLSFWTFDNKVHKGLDSPIADFVGLKKHFHQADLFTEEGKAQVSQIIERDDVHPLVLYCDDGNKYGEFLTFVPKLRAGDYVSVHDWGKEFGPRHAKTMEKVLSPLWFKQCESLDSITRFWRVK